MIKKILHISDTHGLHRQLENLPEADVIVHSGDISKEGTEEEVLDFITWFEELPYRHKVFVAGNHDLCLQGAELEGLEDSCHFLYGSGLEIEGLKFWGIPLLVADQKSGSYEEMIQAIPEDTDILVTHEAPYGICDDNHYPGSLSLLEMVLQVNPWCHLFGHVHEAYGHTTSKSTYFSNAALTDRWCLLNHEPRLIEL